MNDIEEIRSNYIALPSDANEETIKINIVIEFLKFLGYNPLLFRYEPNTNKKIKDRRVDICIEIENKEKNIFYVEVKRKNHEISEEDMRQICLYVHDEHIEWGLLTNGNHYILINDTINAKPYQRCVIEYFLVDIPDNVSRSSNKTSYIFFKQESIFIKKITNYHLLLKKFLLENDNNKTLSSASRSQYYSACRLFINYIISSEYMFDIHNFSISNFKKFIVQLNNSKIKKGKKFSKDSVIAKYRYIYKFANYLETNEGVQNTFKSFDIESFIESLELKESSSSNTNIKNEEIEMLLRYYDSISHSNRNKAIFRLFLYGFEINDILFLKDNQIDFKNNKITFRGKKFPLTNNVKLLLKEIINDKKKDKITCEYTFYTKYKGKYRQLHYNSLSDIVNATFNKIDTDENRKLQLKIKLIKASLIKNLYKNKFTLEEIHTLTNLSIPTIISYIDETAILNKGSSVLRKLEKEHPYINYI